MTSHSYPHNLQTWPGYRCVNGKDSWPLRLCKAIVFRSLAGFTIDATWLRRAKTWPSRSSFQTISTSPALRDLKHQQCCLPRARLYRARPGRFGGHTGRGGGRRARGWPSAGNISSLPSSTRWPIVRDPSRRAMGRAAKSNQPGGFKPGGLSGAAPRPPL